MAKYSIADKDLNLVVLRYLLDSGFKHSAFCFENELRENGCGVDGDTISFATLKTIMQNSIRHKVLEPNASNLLTRQSDTDTDEDFSFLKPMDIIKEDANELKEIIKKRREKEKDEVEEKQGLEQADISPDSRSLSCKTSRSDLTILEGHTSWATVCAWSPTDSLLASGSSDWTTRIWRIPHGHCGSGEQKSPSSFVLKHFKTGKIRDASEERDLPSLAWNGDGSLLATGSCDFLARIWGCDGESITTLDKHKGSVSSLKWNENGDFLLSGSYDRTAVVWDTKTWQRKQRFKYHSDKVYDVDWMNNDTFATCSKDRKIYVWQIGEDIPIRKFSGHKHEVYAIKWDPTGSLLASCSGDKTVKIWRIDEQKHLYDFREHTELVRTISWRPPGPNGANNSNQQAVLASASFDSTIKLWDVGQGRLLNSLNVHRDAIYTIAFSPNCEYLASGGADQCLHIWSVKEGKIVKIRRMNVSIFAVCWNREGDKIAASLASGAVCVVDFRY
ncbi:WD40 repeat-containing protein HOS15-like [Ananas comosus]|uniref:WD40 repeat-containing protein HOS15-like n=1 Tax=Ananas comosus TaxID=4615 RepID=A0A6P5F852_ANACO|nr:WD40 repeat-containing protein HOS15-like [Ananas comosus]